uniref:Uncharacterized protein n=1 Tax=Anguilla anguilla TaxID=7936 RepID=A0A0E9QIR4_ANGAN
MIQYGTMILYCLISQSPYFPRVPFTTLTKGPLAFTQSPRRLHIVST